MPAHSNEFPWMSYYGNYSFFELRMREHSKVNSIRPINASLYKIERADGTIIKAFICECYSFDVAEYIEACQELGELDVVIISSNWCGYTFDVKRHCMSEQVGVYDIVGFMAALNMDRYWEYLTKYEREKFKENGWI
jgi:hypothetical protein